MKRTFLPALLGVLLLAVCACEKEMPLDEGDFRIKADLTVNRPDGLDAVLGGRAASKGGWAEGDVVLVFFQGVPAPKHLELKYSRGKWTATGKGLEAADLGASGKMSAVWLPYGTDVSVVGAGEAFRLQKNGRSVSYDGWFLLAAGADYTCGKKLRGTLDLKIPAGNGARLLCVEVSGHAAGHTYKLYQEFMQPLSFTGASSSGELQYSLGKKGAAIPAEADNTRSVLRFIGVLDAGAVGAQKDYQFSIDDEDASVLYTCDAGHKNPDGKTVLEIGDIRSSSAWTATEYVYLGIDNPAGERICWAKKNLGATVEVGEGSYGNFYAWGDTQGYPLEGTFGSFTCSHPFNVLPAFALDDAGNLKPEYDAAHAALKGLWRLPSLDEVRALNDNSFHNSFDWYKPESGAEIFSKVSGYTDRSLFLPAAGRIGYMWSEGKTDFIGQGVSGYYWTSTCEDPEGTAPGAGGNAYPSEFYFFSGASSVQTSFVTINEGKSVRPVFSVASTFHSLDSGEENGHEYVEMGHGLKWATCNVGASKPEDAGDCFAWAETEPKTEYTWDNYKWLSPGQTDPVYLTKYTYADGQTLYGGNCNWYRDGIFVGDNGDGVEHKTFADYGYADDAARQNWGGRWRTPTPEEWKTLIGDGYRWRWSGNYRGTGIAGYEIESRVKGCEGNRIFLPTTGGRGSYSGYYWASSLWNEYSYNATSLYFDSDPGDTRISWDRRFAGYNVRAVFD